MGIDKFQNSTQFIPGKTTDVVTVRAIFIDFLVPDFTEILVTKAWSVVLYTFCINCCTTFLGLILTNIAIVI